MMKKYVLFGAKTLFFSFLLTLVSVAGWGQEILFSDNFGSTSQNPISRTGWTPVSGSSSNWELRTTGVSSGYDWTDPVFTASGGANIFTNLGTSSTTKTLTFDNSISTIGFTDIKVRFSGLKSGTAPSLYILYSTDGTTYLSAGNVSLTTSWAAYSVTLPVEAEEVSNLRIRFSIVTNNNTSNNIRIDDFQIIGTAPTCATPTVSLQTTSVDNITTTSAHLYGNVSDVGGAALTTRGFQYSTSNTLAAPTAVNEAATATGTYDLATGTLIPNTLYYYRAYAVNGCSTPQTGYSHTSGYPTFTTIHNAPNIETGTAPTSHGFTANWSAPSGTVGSANFTYEIQVSTDNTFATVDFTQANVASTSNSLVINDAALNSSTTYYYRVRANNDGGSSAWSAVSAGITTDVATFTSIKDGDWNTASTWNLNSVPGQNDRVVINHIVSTAIGITRSTSTTVNGTFQLNSGGYVNSGSTNFTYNQTTGTLNFKTNGIYGVNNNDAYWPVTDGPVNVNVLREATDASGSDSGFRLNSANRTIPENGTLSISGYNGSNYAGIFLDSSTLYINGKVSIKPFGFVANTPVYGNASTLEYNNVTSFTVGSEWTGNNTMAGAGVPQNVSLVNNANINMPTGNRGIAGNLTITSGSTVNLNNSNGDLYIAGNWNNAGTFNPNSRAVFLNGSTNQTITGATAFDYLFINNANNVTLASNISVNNNTNSKIDFINGKLILGANNLTLDGDATVTGANASRYIVTNGAGRLIRNVGNTEKEFPVGFTATNYTPVKITNTTGTSNIGVSVKQSITNPVNDPTRMVTLEWNVNSSAATTATIVPNWEAATPVNQGASFNNTGTGELGNYTTSWNIYHPLALATTTTTATGVALRNGVNLIAVGNENTILPASTDSEIVVKSGYVYPQNILYANYQATNIGTPDNSSDIEIAKFTIKDGKRGIITTDDADNLGTTLTALSFSLSNSANVRRIAIYDDEGEEILEQPASSNHTFNFNAAQQLKLTAPDNGTKDFSIRVSFKNTVTDNQNLQISITGATALATGSGFFNAAAGGATTSVAGDNNRIEVVADRIAFGTQPQTTAVNTNLASFTLKFVDENNNLDFDTNRSVAIAPTDGSITDMSSTSPYSITAPHSGVVSISDVKFALPHTNITLTATTTGLLSTNTAVSNAFDIVDGVMGAYYSTNAGNWNDAIWKRLTASGWDFAPGAPASNTTDEIFILHTVNFNLNQATNLKFVTITDTGTLNNNNGNSLNIVAGGKLLIKGGGKYYNNKILKLATDAILEVEDNASLYTSYSSSNALSANLFAGVEAFHPNSKFIIQNAPKVYTSGGNDYYGILNDLTALTPYTDVMTGVSAYFGNIIFENGGNSFYFLYGLSAGNASATSNYLTNGDIIFRTGTGTVRFVSAYNSSTTNSNSSATVPYIIGGNFIIESGYTGNVRVRNDSFNTYLKVKKDIILNGSSNFAMIGAAISNTVSLYVDGNIEVKDSSSFQFATNIAFTGSANVYLGGNLKVSGSIFTHSSTSSGNIANLYFTGIYDSSDSNTIQKIDIANQSTVGKISFKVNSGAYAQLINQNLSLGASSAFNVLSGGTLDFGFDGINSAGTNALNITNNVNSATFNAASGSTLKITSPQGITSNVTGTNAGNVQTMTTGRTYNAGATYHYIGKANQATGTGLPDGLTAKVIVDLQTDVTNENLDFTASGIVKFNSAGTLEIKRGKVIDIPNYGFRNNIPVENEDGESDAQKGNITMTGGRYVVSGSGTKPSLSGNYNLANGTTVEFAGTAATKIRARNNIEYYNIDVSGTNVAAGGKNLMVNNLVKVITAGKLTIPETADNATPYVLTAKKGVQVAEEIPTPPTPAGQLILENNANLMQDDDAVNSGNIKVNRTMKPRWFGTSYPAKEYNFFSSPVEGQDMKKLYNNDPANTLFVLVLDEPANIFKNAKASDYLVKGKGFAVKEPKASYVNGQPDKTKITAQFTGKPNNGSSIASPYTWVSITNQNEGWNLIGNPYPSNLDLIELYKANNNFDDPDDPGNTISPTFKFWDNTVNATYTYDGVNYNQYSYAFFNAKTGLNGDGVEAPGLDDTNPTIPTTNAGSKEPARYVGVAQGFIVEAINSGGNISFNNTMRKAEITGDHFFGKAAADDDKFKLQLVTPQGVVLTQSIVYFDGGNNHFGIEDSKHPDLEVSELFYSFADEEKVLINGRESFNSSDVVPLGVKTYQQGNYKIRIKKLKGIFENGQAVYLKDKSTGMLANLTEGDYEFSQEAGEYTNRFEIVYKPEATLDVTGTNKDTVQVYRDGDDFVVKSSAKSIKEVELYDMSGKLFYKTNANSKEVRIPSYRLVNGIYILKAQLENSEVVNKKIRK